MFANLRLGTEFCPITISSVVAVACKLTTVKGYPDGVYAWDIRIASHRCADAGTEIANSTYQKMAFTFVWSTYYYCYWYQQTTHGVLTRRQNNNLTTYDHQLLSGTTQQQQQQASTMTTILTRTHVLACCDATLLSPQRQVWMHSSPESAF
jgi:hypothetical protein